MNKNHKIGIEWFHLFSLERLKMSKLHPSAWICMSLQSQDNNGPSSTKTIVRQQGRTNPFTSKHGHYYMSQASSASPQRLGPRQVLLVQTEPSETRAKHARFKSNYINSNFITFSKSCIIPGLSSSAKVHFYMSCSYFDLSITSIIIKTV